MLVRYCNTAAMLADYLSKPLQGRSFRLFRAVLLGHKHVSALNELLPTPSEERVEDMSSGVTDVTRRVTDRRSYASVLSS